MFTYTVCFCFIALFDCDPHKWDFGVLCQLSQPPTSVSEILGLAITLLSWQYLSFFKSEYNGCEEQTWYTQLKQSKQLPRQTPGSLPKMLLLDLVWQICFHRCYLIVRGWFSFHDHLQVLRTSSLRTLSSFMMLFPFLILEFQGPRAP